MSAPVIGRTERKALFEKLASDPQFREDMKEDWRKAVKTVGIDAKTLTKGEVKRSDVEPLGGGDVSASSIIITIYAAVNDGQEKIELHDSVLFEKSEE